MIPRHKIEMRTTDIVLEKSDQPDTSFEVNTMERQDFEIAITSLENLLSSFIYSLPVGG